MQVSAVIALDQSQTICRVVFIPQKGLSVFREGEGLIARRVVFKSCRCDSVVCCVVSEIGNAVAWDWRIIRRHARRRYIRPIAVAVIRISLCPEIVAALGFGQPPKHVVFILAVFVAVEIIDDFTQMPCLAAQCADAVLAVVFLAQIKQGLSALLCLLIGEQSGLRVECIILRYLIDSRCPDFY